MKRVLVTGAGGFVGRELLRLLLAAGHQVVALDMRLDGLGGQPNLRTIEGSIGSADILAEALAEPLDAAVHLATVPGGAAEKDPDASRRINIDAMYDLMEGLARQGNRPRFVYASSIAVLGDHLPASGVDDATPLAPSMVYGVHKAMMEMMVALKNRRGELDGVTIRLPGILARPAGPSGMKSAFMSDLFHALLEGRPYRCPVSAQATIWAQSIRRCAGNFVHALSLDSGLLPAGRAVTLPALCFSIGDMVAEIAKQAGADPGLIGYDPDPGLEAAFGCYPPLATPAAEKAGFAHDGDLASLVTQAIAHIRAQTDTSY
jgi:nucleoside-diphosphate-sugar epimerase